MIENLIFQTNKVLEQAKEQDKYLAASQKYLTEFFRWLQLAARHGGNLLDYFHDAGINEIYYYSGKLIGNVFKGFFTELRSGVTVVSEICDKNSTPKNGELSLSTLPKANDIKDVLVAAPYDPAIYNTLSRLGYRAINLGECIYYTLYKSILFKKIEELKKNHPNIKTMCACYPVANRIKSRSEYEQWLASNNIWGVYSPSFNQYGAKPDPYSEQCTYLLKLNGPQNMMTAVDPQSENVHVIDGFRINTDLPQSDPAQIRQVYIFGNSVAFGHFTNDKNTISNSLQRELNEYYGMENNPFAVVNAANFSGHNIQEMIPLIDSISFGENDIAVFLLSYPSYIMEQYDIVNLNTYFERPHDMGEVFLDMSHMNSKGYNAQGTFLFKEMIKNEILPSKENLNGYLEETKNNEIHHEDDQEELLLPEQISQLKDYLNTLKDYRQENPQGVTGSIVMNCNPFTLGHRYLIETAAAQVDRLFIFVVEEDKSVFPFKERFELVKAGTKDLPNVTVVPSGKFIISQLTFHAYFQKSQLQDTLIDPSMDVKIFAQHIAPYLNITVRFAGEEPLDKVTRQYNFNMNRILPQYGIRFVEIPRKEQGNAVISASRVRKLLDEKNFKAISKIVPKTTLSYLKAKYGE